MKGVLFKDLNCIETGNEVIECPKALRKKFACTMLSFYDNLNRWTILKKSSDEN